MQQEHFSHKLGHKCKLKFISTHQSGSKQCNQPTTTVYFKRTIQSLRFCWWQRSKSVCFVTRTIVRSTRIHPHRPKREKKITQQKNQNNTSSTCPSLKMQSDAKFPTDSYLFTLNSRWCTFRLNGRFYFARVRVFWIRGHLSKSRSKPTLLLDKPKVYLSTK